MATTPWRKYRVSEPSTRKNWTEPTCIPFDEVYHVSHITQALHICEVRQINDGLVYDESRLNKHRITVAWLSPNTWANGSRYGNVSFRFNFRELIEGKSFYWVEAIDKYSPPACRILIAGKEYPEEVSSHLTPYDPTSGDGPWWHDVESNTHYRNGNFTLELMTDEPLHLSRCANIDFVDHHDQYCCIDTKKCKDKGLDRGKGGARFIADCLARDISPPSHCLEIEEDSRFVNHSFNNALHYAMRPLFRIDDGYKQVISSSDPISKEIARTMLSCFVDKKRKDEGIELAKLFENEQDVEKAILALAYENFCVKFSLD